MRRLQHEIEASSPRQIGVTSVPVVVADPEEFESAFETSVRANVQVVVIYPDQMLLNQRKRLIELALSRDLPAVFTVPEQVEDGGLISHGISLRGNFGRAAAFVDKILKGAKPADLPIEFPTKLEMAVNLKTAKALGLTIPPALLARAAIFHTAQVLRAHYRLGRSARCRDDMHQVRLKRSASRSRDQ